jgi:hypothetical protein
MIKQLDLENLDLDSYMEIVGDLAKINTDDIDSELASFTVVYSYYHGLLVRAKRLLDGKINSVELLSSTFKNDQRSNAKMTVEALKDLAATQPFIVEAIEEASKYGEIYGYIKAICSTLEHKKDMVIQISANKRSETKLYNTN